jgi:3-oxoacyl-[acyl-carrier-protein] synthase II
MNRVVVTGIGIVSPVGVDRETTWSNAIAGKSGIRPISLFDASTFPVRIGGEATDFDAAATVAQFPEAAGVRDRKVLLALAAAQEAIADSGLNARAFTNAMLCVGVGLESICLGDLIQYVGASNGEWRLPPRVADDADWLQTPLDQIAAILGNRHGLLGGRFTNCSACAAGTQVVGEAWQRLRRHEADVAMVGAADSMLNPLGLGGFSLLRVLSAENESPSTACRPFDVTRQGTVLGEGAAFLILESAEHAASRRARVYCEVVGYGSSLDAFAVSDPDPTGNGAVASMTRALRSAGLTPKDVDCVSAHGTGTPKNDVVETAAIKRVLGRRAYDVPVHSLKSMTGHMIAASGAVEAAVAVLTLARGIVPPTINLQKPDPQCDLDYVPGAARPFHGRTVLSNSFGFGGQNATIILRKAP